MFLADADEQIVTFHTRAWVMHMFGTVLFPDGTGDCALWMYLPYLSSWAEAGRYNWGFAVLSFLYRKLCEICRCSSQVRSCRMHVSAIDLDVGEASCW